MIHLSGSGCQKCANIIKSPFKTVEKFILDAQKLHGNKYDYSLVKYVDSYTPLTIICQIHGEFKQKPYIHLKNSGCQKCAGKKLGGWSFSDWKNRGLNSKYFSGFKVYVIKLYNSEEIFFKIGKTFNKLDRRFKSKINNKYEMEIVWLFESNAKNISKLENKLHKLHKLYEHKPQIYFNGGERECFNKININENLIKSFNLDIKIIKQ